MSLWTDQFFYDALASDSSLDAKVDGRIFNTARNEEDEKEDRIPYIIITYDGMENEQGTKDDKVESPWDNDVISVLVVADNREELADIMALIRPIIADEVDAQDNESQEKYGFLIDDIKLSAGPIQSDPSCPCSFQTLTYRCNTYNNE